MFCLASQLCHRRCLSPLLTVMAAYTDHLRQTICGEDKDTIAAWPTAADRRGARLDFQKPTQKRCLCTLGFTPLVLSVCCEQASPGKLSLLICSLHTACCGDGQAITGVKPSMCSNYRRGIWKFTQIPVVRKNDSLDPIHAACSLDSADSASLDKCLCVFFAFLSWGCTNSK